MTDPVDIEVQSLCRFPLVGGMCLLRFRPGWSTGVDADTNPGIGFDLLTSEARIERSGVIGRADAERLADMIYEFLSQHDAEKAAG